jgi:large subunit ribosomal protein L7/L12
MSDPLRDAVAKAGAKVARCKMNMMLAVRELESAQKAVMDAPAKADREIVYTVRLAVLGANKIGVIKAIREVTNLGLLEAKNLSETVDAVVVDKVSAEVADNARQLLQKAGAGVKIKRQYV